MRFTGMLVSFLTLSLVLLPGLTAQEKDKDKKDPDKTETEKPAKKKEEKVEHGPVLKSKIISMKPDSARDFTIEVPMPDPQAMYQMQMQQAQMMQQLATARSPAQYAQQMANMQRTMAQWQATGYGYRKTPVDMRATEECKVRIMYPPVQYDDAGNIKKWSRKELDKLKAGSKLPGYPSDFDMLKTGQIVEVYLAKQHGSPKDKWSGAKQKKKKKDEDPPDPMPEARPEVVMIVIWAEPMR